MAKKKKSPYANEPHAPANKIANKPLVQNASLGNKEMPMVPTPPMANKPPIGGAHGYGHKPHQHVGKLRTSGDPTAHAFGKK